MANGVGSRLEKATKVSFVLLSGENDWKCLTSEKKVLYYVVLNIEENQLTTISLFYLSN